MRIVWRSYFGAGLIWFLLFLLLGLVHESYVISEKVLPVVGGAFFIVFPLVSVIAIVRRFRKGRKILSAVIGSVLCAVTFYLIYKGLTGYTGFSLYWLVEALVCGGAWFGFVYGGWCVLCFDDGEDSFEYAGFFIRSLVCSAILLFLYLI